MNCARASSSRWRLFPVCAAALLSPPVAGCAFDCGEPPQSIDLSDVCSAPGTCQLPADLSLPLQQGIFQLAGDQTLVIPVSSSLAGLGSTPRFGGAVSFLTGALSPQNVRPPVDLTAIHLAFDSASTDCNADNGGPGVLDCAIPSTVQEVTLTYAAPTPAIACNSEEDCCVSTPGSAACACQDGFCVAPIAVELFLDDGKAATACAPVRFGS